MGGRVRECECIKKSPGNSYLQAIVEDIVPHHKKLGSKVESQLFSLMKIIVGNMITELKAKSKAKS